MCSAAPGSEAASGVFIVYADGTLALDTFYRNGQVRGEVGAKGRTEAASAHGRRLALVTARDAQDSILTIYEAKAGHPDPRQHLLLPMSFKIRQLTPSDVQSKAVEEVAALPLARRDAPASLSIRSTAVAAVWSDGDLQTFALRDDHRGAAALSQTARRRLAGVLRQST